MPRLAQGRSIGGAIEQRQADLRFELLNPIGHCRLSAVQLFGRLREASLVDDRKEDLNLIESQGIHVLIYRLSPTKLHRFSPTRRPLHCGGETRQRVIPAQSSAIGGIIIRYAIIGTRNVGSALVRLFSRARISVSIANTRAANDRAARRAIGRRRIDDSKIALGHVPEHRARTLFDARDPAFTDPFLIMAEDWMPRGAFGRHPANRSYSEGRSL